MNSRPHKLPLLIISVTVGLISMSFVFSTELGFCKPGELDCINFLRNILAALLLPVSILTSVIISILIFLKDEVFKTWLKLLYPFLIIYFLSVYVSPQYCGSSLSICVDRQLTSWFLLAILTILSLMLITYKIFQLRRS